MDHKILLQYITGKLSDNERYDVLEWIDESEENRKRFFKIKNSWVAANLPDYQASPIEVKKYRDQINPTTSRTIMLLRMAAACLILLLSTGLVWQQHIYQTELNYIKNQEITSLKYHTNKGLKAQVTLPDGSKVWLNSDSRLECPSHFAGDIRQLKFSGEGYFDIVKNPKRPMHIELENNITVVVKGTTFNLSSYHNDNKVAALLLNGEISIIEKKQNQIREIKVKPNEKVIIEKKQKQIEKSIPKETLPTIGWKDGWLIFDETPLREVLKKLERWHGIQFIVEDTTILNQNFTARFKDESISQILETMKRIALLDYSLKETTATLRKY